MRIKTNCELPLCMFEHNLNLNDYDFVLYHLYEKNAHYRTYYKEMRNACPDRLMILDNSAYEFFVTGEEFNVIKFVEAIYRLKPDYYIIPDKLMDMEGTKQLLEEFMSYIPHIQQYCPNSKPMGVLQGNGYIDFSTLLYTYKNNNINAIAIPFHNKWYKDISVDDEIYWDFVEEFGETEDSLYAMGRVQTVLNISHWFKDFEHIHLLGSHNPWEIKWVNKYVDSIDTSYPVKLAIAGEVFGKEREKPNIIIDDFLEKRLSDEERKLIVHNVVKFREL